jgi:N-acetylglucosamine kinase-like BadF-type ATPase
MEDILRYYIGIDGGGTKTAVCAACVDDSSLRYTETGGSSWREHGPEKVAQNLREAAGSLVGNDYSQIAGMAMGLPCHGESAEGDSALERAIKNAFAGIPIYFCNDVEVGWAGSLVLTPGINIVAGTGAIAFGKDSSGQTARSGGWSEFFGDEGSCYWAGLKVMELFSKQSDGRMPKDMLYETVRREFNIQNDFNLIDIFHNEYITTRKKVASLQFIAEKAGLAGSPSAIALYEEAVRELLLLVTSIRNKLNFSEKPFIVSYTGGLFKAKELVLDKFSREVEKEGGRLALPCFGPAEGAVLLAFQQFFHENLPQIIKIMMARTMSSEQ